MKILLYNLIMKRSKKIYKFIIGILSTSIFLSIPTSLIVSCSTQKNNETKSNLDNEVKNDEKTSQNIDSNFDDKTKQNNNSKQDINSNSENTTNTNDNVDNNTNLNLDNETKHTDKNSSSNLEDGTKFESDIKENVNANLEDGIIIYDNSKYNNLPSLKKHNWYINDSKLPSIDELQLLENDYSIYELKNNSSPIWKQKNASILPYSYNSNISNLPIFDDKNISDDDLMQMFDYIAYKTISFDMFSKNIKIDAHRLSKLYIKWTIERWKLFPYFSFENGNMKFNVQDASSKFKSNKWFSEDEINNEWYLYSISSPDFLDKLYKNGKYKNAFLNFVWNGLKLISKDMSPRDKVWAIYNYILDYFKYSWIIYEQDESIYKHDGVCANYASAYSFLLNIIGIPSLPMLTGFRNNDYGSLHEVVWLNLDLYNDGNPKWYLSDATFSDEINKNALLGKNYAFSNSNHIISNFLLPVGKNKFESHSGVQFPYGQYWGLPLPKDIIDNACYSDKNYISTIFETNIAEKHNGRFQKKYKLSKFIYIDNKYYALRKNNFKNRVDFVVGTFFDSIEKLRPIEINNSPFSGIPLDIYWSILRTSNDDYPLLWKRDNYVFFILDNENNVNKRLLIYNIENKKYNIYDFEKLFSNNNELFKNTITNFYVDSKFIVFETKNNSWKINLFDYIYELNWKKEFDDLYEISLLKLNSYRDGNKYWEINELYKKWFYKKLNLIKSDVTNNNEYKNGIKMIEEWNNLIDYYFSIKDLDSFVIKQNDDIVQVNNSFAKRYPFKLSRILYFGKDVYDIFNYYDEYIVDLKYKNDNNEYESFPLKNNLYYESELEYNELIKLANKDLKLVLKNFNNENLFFETSEFKIKLIDDNDPNNLPIIEKLSINNNINDTNLSNIPLVKDDVNSTQIIDLKLRVNNINCEKYEHKLKLFYRDFNNNNRMLKLITINKNSSYFEFKINKSSNNIGSYWVVIESKNKEDNQIYKTYSNSVYVLDWDNFKED